MPKNLCQAVFRGLLIPGAALVAYWAGSGCATGWATLTFDGSPNYSLSTSPEIDTTWRHTRYGWQDSARWPVADSFVPLKTVELVHPILWAGIVVIAVMISTIWASSEWDTARLFQRDPGVPEGDRPTGVDPPGLHVGDREFKQ